MDGLTSFLLATIAVELLFALGELKRLRLTTTAPPSRVHRVPVRAMPCWNLHGLLPVGQACPHCHRVVHMKRT